jgi:hypothetical protein
MRRHILADLLPVIWKRSLEKSFVFGRVGPDRVFLFLFRVLFVYVKVQFVIVLYVVDLLICNLYRTAVFNEKHLGHFLV